MSPWMSGTLQSIICFPRVSGDEPFAAYANGGIWEFSPRERG